MRLTAKARYAVTAMLDLAFNGQAGPVRLSEVSERQDISLAYLEQLFAKLRRHELVSSIRGPGGGYVLAGTPEAIFVADIVEAVGEGVDATNCGGAGGCQSGHTCLTHHLWADLSKQINDFLSGISLAQLMQRNDVQAVSRRQHGEAQNIEIALQAID